MDALEKLLDRADMVQCLVKYDGVIETTRQPNPVQVSDPVVNVRQALFGSLLSRDINRDGRTINGIHFGGDPESDHCPFQATRAAAERQSPAKPRPPRSGIEMIQRIGSHGSGDPSVDGIPAGGMSHPEVRILRNMVMMVPEPAADRSGERRPGYRR
jgi:hypothetical protein